MNRTVQFTLAYSALRLGASGRRADGRGKGEGKGDRRSPLHR